MKKVLILNQTTHKLELVQVEEITLEFLQQSVGGYIEHLQTSLQNNQIICYVNEEGRFMNLKPSAYYIYSDEEDGECEVLLGNIIFLSYIEDVECGLSDEQIQIVKDAIENHYIFSKNGLLPVLTKY